MRIAFTARRAVPVLACIATPFAALLLIGCGATVKIRSNAKPDFHPKIERVFVAIRPGEEWNEKAVCQAMGVHFDTLLIRNGYQARITVGNSVDLEDEDGYLPEMKAYHADLGLVVKPDGKVYLNYGKFRVTAFDSSLTSVVWKASVEGDFIGNGYGAIWGLIGKRLAEGILRRLDEDHILPLKYKLSGSDSVPTSVSTSSPSPF